MIVLDHCPGCGVCTRPKVCPMGTISIPISGGKAVIGQGCIDCGLCIPACPIGLIKPDTTPEKEQDQPAENAREEGAHEQTSTGA